MTGGNSCCKLSKFNIPNLVLKEFCQGVAQYHAKTNKKARCLSDTGLLKYPAEFEFRCHVLIG